MTEMSGGGVRRARLSQGAEVLARRVAEGRETERQGAADCDVLIVGSGYGGAVAAARLAGAARAAKGGAKVWVLERGQEHLPGSFPSSFGELPGQVRFSHQDGKPPRGAVEGMFDVRLGTRIHALVGNGLGGGSLINAGVMEEPDPDCFADQWPTGVDSSALQTHYDRAREMLGAAFFGATDKLGKVRALAALQAGLAADNQRGVMASCRIAVSESAGTSAAGMAMHACTGCGDCVTGCNQGAKGTLDTNYLAWAFRRGAELFCGGWVERIRPAGDRSGDWLVSWHYTDPKKRPAGKEPFELRTRCLVLAAGSFGSTEILLRSRGKRFPLSARLGARFSTNGDQIVASFRQKDAVHASRDVTDSPGDPCNVGPTINAMARVGGSGGMFTVQDFAIPGALRQVMGEVTTTFGLLHGLFGSRWPKQPDATAAEDEFAVTTASLEHTAIFGVMGDDQAPGRLELTDATGTDPTDGQLRIVWPDDEATRNFESVRASQFEVLKTSIEAAAIGGIAVPDPLWRGLPASISGAIDGKVDGEGPRGSGLTVHPLGGCRMADRVAGGVVNAFGQVFRGDAKDGAVYPTLAVLDGSIVPRALGINPSLTIAALAERAVPTLATAFGLTLASDTIAPAKALPRPAEPLPTGWTAPTGHTSVRIAEQMHGLVHIDGGEHWAELEIPAIDIDDLPDLLRRTGARRLEIGTEGRPAELRLYPVERRSWVLADAADVAPTHTIALTGAIVLLVPGPKQPDEIKVALEAIAVLADRLSDGKGALSISGQSKAGANESASAIEDLLEAVGLLARTWTIRYEFAMPKRAGKRLPAGTTINGTKTLAFSRGANPWKQMSRMQLDPRGKVTGELRTDLAYFARYRSPLLSLTRQRDQPSALADLAALALYTLRLSIVTHWPHLVPPRDMPPTIAGDPIDASRLFGQDEAMLITAGRRPGTLDGIAPEWHSLGGGLTLSRYKPKVIRKRSRPLMMIHGLSAAGSTFAHPSIRRNLVRTMLAPGPDGRDGRDVWVVDLRTSSANEPVDGSPRSVPSRFEDVAGCDIPKAIEFICKETGHQQVDVIAHCVGAVMICEAMLTNSDLARKIDRLVLSQVGPLARLSQWNRFRGFVASFLQAYLQKDELEVRPDYRWDGPAGGWVRKAPGDPHGSMAMDAILATMPYPDDDFESARVEAIGTDFRRVRHHADAIFGQLFRLQNLGDDTLRSLDAIFGFAKTTSVANVAHIARERRLTDTSGDTLLSARTMIAGFPFPVLLLHGRRNEVFDWRGSLESWKLLRHLSRGSVPSTAADGRDLHLGGRGRHRLSVFGDYGHQDLLIGENAHVDVFPHIESFLASKLASGPKPPTKTEFECSEPWIGPVQGWMRAVGPSDSSRAELSLSVFPGRMLSRPVCVVLVPMRREGTDWQPDGLANALGYRVDSSSQNQRNSLREDVLTFSGTSEIVGRRFAVLLLHRTLRSVSELRSDFEGPSTRGGPGGFALKKPAINAIDRFFADPRRPFSGRMLSIEPRAYAARDLTRLPKRLHVRSDALSFALASCQFPPSLFDKGLADASFRAALGREPLPGFLLLLGDQVYLDALGNVFEDPNGDDPEARARRAYEINLRLPNWRRYAARVPVYPMLDDHEVCDDWQPPPAAAELSEQDRSALAAYDRNLGKLAPPRPGPTRRYAFLPGGFPFFVFDTRSGRERRSVIPTRGAKPIEVARIVPDEDMNALEAWLAEHANEPVKFIASPSVVLPFEGDDSLARLPERLGYDSWSGYPASLHRLFEMLRTAKGTVVLLSGDPHLSVLCEFKFAGKSGPRVISIVSSGTYTPWPFANDRIADLRVDADIDLELGHGHRLAGRVVKHMACDRAGVATVELTRAGSRWNLSVAFGGNPACVETLAL